MRETASYVRGQDRGARGGDIAATTGDTTDRRVRSLRRAETMIRTLQRVAQFDRIRRAWLGEGGEPVPLELAQQRADTCNSGYIDPDTGKPVKCPFNYEGSWIWNTATRWTVAAWSQFRAMLRLHLRDEEKLGVCEVCGCRLTLKVHTPFKHIYRQTTPEMLARYPSHCWLQKEKPTT